ncbi:MAG TPA: hypothetical protein VMW69_15795 [Spirochaetia bacterium]|nr:hypothetical protein [Spirochaetia bacterium]
MSTANVRKPIPEINKKPGMRYIWFDNRFELPVIDITHPAFDFRPSDDELEALERSTIHDLEEREKVPKLLQSLMLKFYLRGSVLASHITRSRGGYLDALGTYLLKLGPANLGSGYATKVDRAIASSLPCVSVRMRLRETAGLIAEAAARLLSGRRGVPLYLVDIAGGTAMDSVNALIVLMRDHHDLIKESRVELRILDRDDKGPAFGIAALEELRKAGAPLAEIAASAAHVAYDWSNTEQLGTTLDEVEGNDGVAVCSSEGGLLDYGSDEEITANLRALGRLSEDRRSFIGTISRVDGFRNRINADSGAALNLRNLEDFTAHTEAAGWRVKEARECPLCYCLLLE